MSRFTDWFFNALEPEQQVVFIVAVIGVIGVIVAPIIAGYFGLRQARTEAQIPIDATQTAEALATEIASQVIVTANSSAVSPLVITPTSTAVLTPIPTSTKPPNCSRGGVIYYVVTGETTREELEDNRLVISQSQYDTKDLIIKIRTDSGCEVSFFDPPNLLGEGELTVPADRKVAENGFAELKVTYTAPAASTAPNNPIVALLKFFIRLDGSESQVHFSPADLKIEVQ